MPVHRVPRARLHEDVADIEHQGERIVCVVDDDTHVLIFTAYLRPEVETR